MLLELMPSSRMEAAMISMFKMDRDAFGNPRMLWLLLITLRS